MFLGGIDFTLDGLLVGASTAEEAEDQSGFYQISLIIVDGEPQNTATEINDDFSGRSCFDVSSAPDGTLYCINENAGFENELHTVDLDAGTTTVIGNIGIEGSLGNGLAVGSDGVIYLGNQIGL